MFFFSQFLPKKFLGVDIGTSAIKIVELSRWGDRRKLENYGEIQSKILYEKPFRTFEKSSLSLSTKNIARALSAVIEEAKIKTKDCIFSIPDFSTFFTNFDLPPMTKDELPEAVRYEARQHIPVPLGEVTLDWQVVDGASSEVEKKTKLKVLLAAVPNEIINQYKEIAEICQLRLTDLEAEVFGLIRATVPANNREVVELLDIGAQSTTCSIIDKKILKISHSYDMAGNELTQQISKSLSVDYQTAEKMKKEKGMEDKNIKDVLLPLIDLIIREAERISQNFSQSENKEVKKIILAGGAAAIPGMKEYFKSYSGKEVELANPFSKIFYPPILEKNLKDMGPSYAIALGVALRGLE